MSFIFYNPNPLSKRTGDCVIRAISISSGKSWNEVFEGLVTKAYYLKDMPSLNPVWYDYLIDLGYIPSKIPNSYPRRYTIRDFSIDHPIGNYILGTGEHAVALIDGNYIDTWDSGNEIPIYVFKKGD